MTDWLACYGWSSCFDFNNSFGTKLVKTRNPTVTFLFFWSRHWSMCLPVLSCCIPVHCISHKCMCNMPLCVRFSPIALKQIQQSLCGASAITVTACWTRTDTDSVCHGQTCYSLHLCSQIFHNHFWHSLCFLTNSHPLNLFPTPWVYRLQTNILR